MLGEGGRVLPGPWLLSCLPREVWQRHPRGDNRLHFPPRSGAGEMPVDGVQQVGLASLAGSRETPPPLPQQP